MKVSELIEQFGRKMRPYADLDVDKDCFVEVDGVDLMDALQEAFDNTDVSPRYWWNYDD